MVDVALAGMLVLGYALIGGGLKYIDQVYDVHIFDKKLASALALLCGIIMGTLIAVDWASSVILTSIILGVLFAGKIDNKDFITVTVLSFAIPFLYTLFINPNYQFQALMLYSIISLVLLGIGDELLDKIGDKKHIKMLTIRPLLKLGVLALAIMGIFDYEHFLAFIGFDTAYMLVGLHSANIIKGMTILEIKAKNIKPEEI